MSVEAWTALVHMYCTVVKHAWLPCFFHAGKSSHIYSISWCQKWHVFRKTSMKCTRSSSSKNCGTFHFSSFNRDFQFSIFDLLDSITAIFKSHISSFSRKFSPRNKKNLGGRLIHRIDLYTDKYGKCTIPSMDCLTPGDTHKSCKLFKQICCL